MEGLATTNVMLGIMAAVSVLEALLIIGAAVAGYFAYKQVMTLVNGIEERQVAPAMSPPQRHSRRPQGRQHEGEGRNRKGGLCHPHHDGQGRRHRRTGPLECSS